MNTKLVPKLPRFQTGSVGPSDESSGQSIIVMCGPIRMPESIEIIEFSRPVDRNRV